MKASRDEQAFADLLEGIRQDAPGEMAKLARLAQALEYARPTTGPSPAFRNALRNRVLAEAAVRRSWVDRVAERWAERNARLRRSFRFVFATGVAALVLLTSGAMFMVADTAVPGDWDYWAKRLHENARLVVTRAPESRAYLQMDLARERLDEARELANRGEDEAAPYLEAFNDMDARTLDATSLLVGVFRRTSRTGPLEKLTQFAVAQRNGLEVLIDRLPPAARPPARDSLEILTRVSERVTGIMGGCICPANPLLPNVGSGAQDRGGADDDEASEEPVAQAPQCACERFRGGDSNGSATGNPQNPRRGGGNGGGETPPPEDPGISVPNLPDVGGIDVDEVVNELIDDALETVEPLVEPIVGPLPTGLVSP